MIKTKELSLICCDRIRINDTCISKYVLELRFSITEDKFIVHYILTTDKVKLTQNLINILQLLKTPVKG